MTKAVLVLASALLLACAPEGFPQRAIRCGETARCPGGLVCYRGFCVANDPSSEAGTQEVSGLDTTSSEDLPPTWLEPGVQSEQTDASKAGDESLAQSEAGVRTGEMADASSATDAPAVPPAPSPPANGEPSSPAAPEDAGDPTPPQAPPVVSAPDDAGEGAPPAEVDAGGEVEPSPPTGDPDTPECSAQTCCNGTRLLRCATQCLELMTTDEHCGACFRSCDKNQVCMGGTCCRKDQLACGGRCIDPKADRNNCGECGRRCHGSCKAGECKRGAP